LYNKYAKKTSLYDYRLSVIKTLLPKIVITQIVKKKRKPSSKKSWKNDKKNININDAKFVREGIRKDTIYYCGECKDKLGLRLESCFDEYHKDI